VSQSIADIAHEIISKVNDNKKKIDELRDLTAGKNDKIHARIDAILISKMCMESDSITNELLSISSRVYRQYNELVHIGAVLQLISDGKGDDHAPRP
jgi:hypothetical protein